MIVNIIIEVIYQSTQVVKNRHPGVLSDFNKLRKCVTSFIDLLLTMIFGSNELPVTDLLGLCVDVQTVEFIKWLINYEYLKIAILRYFKIIQSLDCIYKILSPMKIRTSRDLKDYRHLSKRVQKKLL